jgi:hypothetical protein
MTEANAARIAYRQAFVERVGYEMCEVCRRSGVPTSVHHIVYLSRAPGHPNVNDPRNLILLDTECHSKFHASELPEIQKKLEQDRGLDKLFGDMKSKQIWKS